MYMEGLANLEVRVNKFTGLIRGVHVFRTTQKRLRQNEKVFIY